MQCATVVSYDESCSARYQATDNVAVASSMLLCTVKRLVQLKRPVCLHFRIRILNYPQSQPWRPPVPKYLCQASAGSLYPLMESVRRGHWSPRIRTLYSEICYALAVLAWCLFGICRTFGLLIQCQRHYSMFHHDTFVTPDN